MNDQLPTELTQILEQTPELRRAYLVGGCVRDWLLGIAPKDFDVEVFGVDYAQLVSALGRWGHADDFGGAFGVVKLTTDSGRTFDFSLPRRDAKVAPGHKGFEVAFDPSIDPQAAGARRDFTINALLFDPRRREVLDFFGGERDLRARVLRHVNDSFAEDPLRVLRGMQLAARFDLEPARETVELCRLIKRGYFELPVERVREEWFKWAEKSAVPSRGLQFLVATGWVEYFPEINALIGVPQDPEWHPEGDVFVHTGHCCDALVHLPGWQAADAETRIVLLLAMLSHDFAKPQTTHEAIKDGRLRIVSPGHEQAGGPLAEQFLQRLGVPQATIARVVPLVTHHLAHSWTLTDRSIRKLARQMAPESIDNLCLIITADQFGKPPIPQVPSASLQALQAKAAELKVRVEPPKPILLGRHLIELGLKPGKPFKEILDRAFEAQLDGEFGDLPTAFRWLSGQAELPLTETARARAVEPSQQSR